MDAFEKGIFYPENHSTQQYSQFLGLGNTRFGQWFNTKILGRDNTDGTDSTDNSGSGGLSSTPISMSSVDAISPTPQVVTPQIKASINADNAAIANEFSLSNTKTAVTDAMNSFLTGIGATAVANTTKTGAPLPTLMKFNASAPPKKTAGIGIWVGLALVGAGVAYYFMHKKNS